ESGWLSYAVGLYMLLFGGTNAMAQLRESMQTIWHVPGGPEDRRPTWVQTLTDAGFVGILCFLLLSSVVLITLLHYGSFFLSTDVPGFLMALLGIGCYLLTTSALAVIFGVLFRVLPAKNFPLKCVAAGAAVSAVLFTLGRYLMILWLTFSDIGSVYGSLTFFIILMFWVYFTAQIIL